ncbi:diguanylate cyclase domain-containing protein [Actinoplanes sp. NPDC049681]|uniref:diguanylate cyclase domain-containing protein n=1 Tax=Actinoplanes sp. NPDC049681 TaxID=3363905 RepID=UPI0037AE7EF6
MAREALRGGYERLRLFVRRDLMRSLRLTFLLALALSAVGLTVQMGHMAVGAGAVCAVVQLFGLALRLVEFRRGAPVPVWVDALELGGLLLLLSQVTAVHPVISVIYMSLLFRAAIGGFWRLILSQAGYLLTWLVAIALFPSVDAVPGAMISLPTTTLLVYGTRTLTMRLQEQQRAQSALLGAVLSELPFPVVVADTGGAVVLANPAVAELVGWTGSGEPQLGDLRLQDVEGRPVDLRRVIADATRAKLEVQLVRADGSTRQLKVQTMPITGGIGAGSGVVLALLDVTAQRMHEQHLHRAAYFDMLTGLPNRRMLFERLQLAHRTDMPYGLLLIDLNDFKAVNDTHGHKVGDELLAGVAERIRSAVDEQATVARLGGDEFAVLLPHTSAAEVEAAADRVRETLVRPLPLSCGPVLGRGTVGLAVAEPGQSPEDVMERADAAMYLAKPARPRLRTAESPRTARSGDEVRAGRSGA